MLMVQNYVALAENEGGATPAPEDVCAADMDEDVLRIMVAKQLGLTYLQPAVGPPEWPAGGLQGTLWGYQNRPFYKLQVARGASSVWAPFFSDSRASQCFLNESTFRALGFTDNIPTGPNPGSVDIHGFRVHVWLARGHLEGVNVLGASFKQAAGAKETADFSNGTLSMQCLFRSNLT
ncbi:hypothetical protein WJX72_008152 [[Myrmecia] bisecta]|uniref:Uncharacterized protein n=1 Tax=[Myrmecia] bisecta TaxID=41462 RepID=A0AAW1PLT7_9CHLO